MNYELAKKLKEAGFPHKFCSYPGGIDICVFPTLSELIEACGNRFHFLKLGTKEIGDFEVSNWWYTTARIDKNEIFPIVGGKTPEEAVCNLWLALNKK